MANSTIPTFAVASRDKIQSYINSQQLSYPSYVFCKDKNTLVFVDKNLQIQDIKGSNQLSIVECNVLPSENIQSNTFYLCDGKGYLRVGDAFIPVFKEIDDGDYDLLNNVPIVNKIGTLNSPIVLKDLKVGSYSISGQYRVNENNTIYLSSKNIIVLVESDDTHKCITVLGRNVRIYTVNLETNEITEKTYATQAWVEEQGYTTEDYVIDAINGLYNKIINEVLITKVSQLENDLGFLTAENLNEISDEAIADLF